MTNPQTTLPSTNRLLNAYFGVHAPLWAAEAMSGVLTPAQSAEITALTAELTAAIAATDAIRASAKTATATENAVAAKLRRAGNARIATIRSYATTSDNPDKVYEDAQVPPRAKGTPTPAPAAPVRAEATLEADGTVTVTWGGRTSGVTFVVQRSLTNLEGEATPFVTLASNARKPFNDPTVPAGTRSVLYRLRAVNAGTVAKDSPWSEPAMITFVADAPGQSALRIAA